MDFATVPDVLREPLHGFELAARKAMQFRASANQAKANICGAFQEMVDNVLETLMHRHPVNRVKAGESKVRQTEPSD